MASSTCQWVWTSPAKCVARSVPAEETAEETTIRKVNLVTAILTVNFRRGQPSSTFFFEPFSIYQIINDVNSHSLMSIQMYSVEFKLRFTCKFMYL